MTPACVNVRRNPIAIAARSKIFHQQIVPPKKGKGSFKRVKRVDASEIE